MTEENPGRALDTWDWAAILGVAGFVLSTVGHFVPVDTEDERTTRATVATATQMISGVAALVSLLARPPLCPPCERQGHTSRMQTTDGGVMICPSCGYRQTTVGQHA